MEVLFGQCRTWVESQVSSFTSRVARLSLLADFHLSLGILGADDGEESGDEEADILGGRSCWFCTRGQRTIEFDWDDQLRLTDLLNSRLGNRLPLLAHALFNQHPL